jgi:hypothetical protein
VRRPAAPAGTGGFTRRATPRRSRPPGVGCPPGAAPWQRPWLQAQYALFLRSAAQRVARSQSQTQQVALSLRGAWLGRTSRFSCAAQHRAKLGRSSSRRSCFSSAAQRRYRRNLSRSSSLHFSCAAQHRARLSRVAVRTYIAPRSAELGLVAVAVAVCAFIARGSGVSRMSTLVCCELSRAKQVMARTP